MLKRWMSTSLGVSALLVSSGCGAPISNDESRVAANSDASSSTFAPEAPRTLSSSIEIFHFAELDKMVATSDLVIQGRVSSISRGPMIGDSDYGKIEMREVEVRVTESIYGSGPDELLTFFEEGWTNGQQIEVNGVEASQVGDFGLYFLIEVPGFQLPKGSYVLISSQGRYLREGQSDSVRASNSGDEFGRSLASRGYNRLRADTRQEAERARRGEVQPQD